MKKPTPAARIELPDPISLSPEAVRQREDTAIIFRRIRALLDDCEPERDKNHLAVIAISACIIEGINTGKRIVGAMKRSGSMLNTSA